MSNKQHTPAQVEAIEVADANLNNADLPLYSSITKQRDELLAALEGIVDAIQMDDPSQLAFNMPFAMQAIAKAKGGAA